MFCHDIVHALSKHLGARHIHLARSVDTVWRDVLNSEGVLRSEGITDSFKSKCLVLRQTLGRCAVDEEPLNEAFLRQLWGDLIHRFQEVVMWGITVSCKEVFFPGFKTSRIFSDLDVLDSIHVQNGFQLCHGGRVHNLQCDLPPPGHYTIQSVEEERVRVMDASGISCEFENPPDLLFDDIYLFGLELKFDVFKDLGFDCDSYIRQIREMQINFVIYNRLGPLKYGGLLRDNDLQGLVEGDILHFLHNIV